MIRSIINKFISSALKEIFTDSGGRDNVHISLDIFSDSAIELESLTFRSDIFDVCLAPLHLVHGHVGKLSIVGVLEAFSTGGRITCNVNDLYLLFHVDKTATIEQIQLIKKIYIELFAGKIQQELIRDLLKKIQKMTPGKDPDLSKKRKVLLSTMYRLYSNFNIIIKNVHIRIEMESLGALISNTPSTINVLNLPQSNTSSNRTKNNTQAFCNSLGILISSIRLTQCKDPKPGELGKNDPYLMLVFKAMQVYCDYNCASYLSSGVDEASIFNYFHIKSKQEIHTGFILPFDVEIKFSAEIKPKIGILLPKFSVKLPKYRMNIDNKQLLVLKQLLNNILYAMKRNDNLVRVKCILDRETFVPPKLFETGGIHILPYFIINGDASKKYPLGTGLPRSTTSFSLISSLKNYFPNKSWIKELWKHIIHMTILDIRSKKKYGRWFDLAKLCLIRKRYAFIYSRLLRESSTTGNFVYGVNSKLSPRLMRQLFEYELILPLSSIIIFRSLAHMICYVNSFNQKRKEAIDKGKKELHNSSSTTKRKVFIYEKVNITWSDILLIQSRLSDNMSQTAFHSLINRDNSEDDGDLSGSSSSSSTSVGGQSVNTGKKITPTKNSNPTKSSSATTTPNSSTSIFSFFKSSEDHSTVNTTSSSSAATTTTTTSGGKLTKSATSAASSVASAASKMIKNVTGAIGLNDELDMNILGGVSFSDLFSAYLPEPEERLTDSTSPMKENDPSLQATVELRLNEISLGGNRPSWLSIVEAVEWATMRNQRPLSFILPDIMLNINSIEINLKTPLNYSGSMMVSKRVNILSIKLEKIVMSISISNQIQALITTMNSTIASSPTSKLNGSGKMDPKNPQLTNQVKAKSGFVSLLGCLVQLRVSMESLNVYLTMTNTQVHEIGKKYQGTAALSPQSLKSSSSENSLDLSLGDDDPDPDSDEDTGANKINSKASNKVENTIIDLIKSKKGDDILMICLIVDYDELSGGSADFQVYTGNFNIDINGDAVALLVDATNAENYLTSLLLAHDISVVYGSIKSNNDLLYDHYHQCGIVQPKYLGANISNSLESYRNEDASKKFISLKAWHKLIKKTLPGTVTTVFRTSPFTINILSGAAIKQYIGNWTKNIAEEGRNDMSFTRIIGITNILSTNGYRDRSFSLGIIDRITGSGLSSSGRSSIGGDTKAPINPSNTSDSVSYLYNILLNLRKCEPNEEFSAPSDRTICSNPFSITIPNFEFLVSKLIVPFPSLRVTINGIVLTIPLDDETMCELLAQIFSHFINIT